MSCEFWLSGIRTDRVCSRFQEAFVSNRHQLTEIEPMALVLLDVRDDEPEVGGDEPLGG